MTVVQFHLGIGQRVIGCDTEAGAVGDTGRLGDAANRNVGFGLRGVRIPDRPRVDLALGEGAQRVGGLQKDQRDVGRRKPGPVQLPDRCTSIQVR